MKIKDIFARQILDSRGNPTIEVEIITSNNIYASASVPSGASKGKYEALELRDYDYNFFMGKSVYKAVNNVNTIIKKEIVGMPINQKKIDKCLIDLDGTENKSNLGANAILGVSMAIARVAAKELKLNLFDFLKNNNENCSLPIPLVNIINGGAHADNNLNFQEFMIVPVGSKTFEDSIRMIAEIFYNLKIILKKKNLNTNVGDEGGFAPNLNSDEEAIELILEAIEKAKYKIKEDVSLAIDAAASEFYDEKTCCYILKNKHKLSSKEMISLWLSWLKKFPIISLEDPLAEDDWNSWSLLSQNVKKGIKIIGDDLFATNIKRFKKGILEKACNSILVKMNQIGTLSETMSVIAEAKKNNFTTIISHRSGETEDTFIADLSVAVNAEYIKTGSITRSERTSKYNRLLKIAEKLK